MEQGDEMAFNFSPRYTIWWLVKICPRRITEIIYIFIALHLPKELVTWCFVRVAALATSGKYGQTNVPRLTVVDALKRWQDG